MAKEKPPITVVGDVGGRIAIIVVWRCVVILHAVSFVTLLGLSGLSFWIMFLVIGFQWSHPSFVTQTPFGKVTKFFI
jgi:hypothetical protein